MSRPKTFYLAAPSSDIPRAQALAKRVQDATGCTLTHDWMPYMLRGGAPTAEAAWDDLTGVAKADFVVLIDGPSRGASVELGCAIGTGTPVFALSDKPDLWLLAAQARDGGEWGIETIASTEDELLELLRRWIDLRS